jgi:DNA-directed RNA polymerase subunit RPC12/RpoP
MAKGVLKWILYVISAGFIVLGGLFLMAAFPPYEYRLLPGIALIVIAVVLLYFSREKRPIEIRQTVDVSGPITTKAIPCPICSANLNADNLEVVDGRPFVTCDYCGNKIELTEEPTW